MRVEQGARAVPAAWTIKDGNGELLPHFIAGSRLEVARKIVRTRYDTFRLEVSPSYREVFDRDLKNVLEREHWQIVPVKGPSRTRGRSSAQLDFALN